MTILRAFSGLAGTPVVARALAIAKFLVVAAGLVEVLALEGEGEVVEELAELGGGLVAEFVR